MHLRFLTAIPLFLALALAADSADGAPKSPNILVILVDDMGYSDLGCFGSEIKTPNLDALAENGLRYTQMYNTSKCYPTRACLLTGVYFQRTDREFPGTATAGEVLRPAGYRTLWSGKHHANFNPTTRGFDAFSGFLGGAINFWHPGKTAREGETEPQRIMHYRWVVDEKEIPEYIPPKGWYATDGFTDWALEWLKEKSDKPFFLYVAYNTPHWPLHAHQKDIDKYDGVYDKGYGVIRKQRYQRQIEAGLFEDKKTGLPNDPLDEAWASLSDKDKQLEADRMEVHAAMVDNLDQNVGRLVDQLKSNGQLDNTIIFFLADNGASPERTSRAKLGDSTGKLGDMNTYECIGRNWAHAANTPLRLYKATSHEGGINTPMIVHWPEGLTAEKGSICREPCHLIDLLPTWMDLTGADYPGESKENNVPAIDGISLTPTFSDKSLNREKPLFFQFGGGKAVRDGDWKLVARKGTWELYNLADDRNEKTNLITKHPEKAAEMEKAWNEWNRETSGSKKPKKKK